MQNKYLKNITLLLSVSILSKVAGGFATFFIAKALQPSDYGIWITMTLVVSLSPILTFGTLETLLKHFPFYKGRGETEIAGRLEYVVFTATILTAFLVLIIGCVFAVFVKRSAIEYLQVAILFMTIATCLSFPSEYFYFRFLAHQDFRLAAMLDSIRTLLNLIFIVAFSYYWGVPGAAAGYCLIEVIICAMSAILSSRSHGRVKLLFDFRAIWDAVIVGMPITIFWWLLMVQGSAERMLSISLLGKTATGYYGLGISIVSVLSLLPQSISRVFYPRINEKFGESSNERDLLRIVTFPTYFISLFLPGAIGLMVIFLPVVYSIFPKYLPGLLSGQILVLVSFSRLIMSNGISFLIATNRQNRLCLIVIACLCVGLTVSYGAIYFGFGIEGLALSSGFSSFILVFLLWCSVFATMGFSRIELLLETAKLYVPFGLMLLFVGLGSLILPQFLVQTNVFILGFSAIFALLFSVSIFLLPMTRRWIVEMLNVFRGAPESPTFTSH